MNKAVFITGCSTGIGLQAVIELANSGYTVFAGVRSSIDQETLIQLAQTSNTDIIPVICEVTDNESVRQAAITVKNQLQGKYLTGVINNAGIVFSGPLLHLSLLDWETVFAVNVTGVLRVIQVFAPLLGLENTGQHKGRIINISSVSGIANFPLNGSYCASKHALESLSVVLRRELSLYGIPVIVIQPGNVNTEIWHKIPNTSPFADTEYGSYHQGLLNSVKQSDPDKMASPSVIVATIMTALESQHPKATYFMPGESFKTKLKFMFNHVFLRASQSDKKFAIKRKS